MPGVEVKILIREKSEDLRLDLLAGNDGIASKIQVYEINRPVLAFTGHLDDFPSERIQIIGLAEYTYLNSLPQDKRKEILNNVFSMPNIPCCVLTRGLEPLPEIIEVMNQNKVPLIRTQLQTSQIISELTYYLEDKLAESTKVHGVLVNVYGLGVIITGNAGIGKSECALELVKRGHMLVADDVVEIKHRLGGILIGSGEEIIRHHIEVRGLGIIDVKSLFGIGSILDESRIELEIRLEDWDPKKEYERVGLEEHFANILGVKIPEVVFPVRPGRNLAVLVEIAALNQRLKNKGHFTAQELNKRLIKIMSNL